MHDYYAILSLSRFASPAEIKHAYRAKAKLYHPDLHPGQPEYEEAFKLVNEAYEVLSNKERKAHYDYIFSSQELEVNQRTETQPYQRPSTAYTQRPTNKGSSTWYNSSYEYSTKVKLQGAAFVLFIILLVTGGPLGLEIWQSEKDFAEGMEFYEDGNYFAAINRFELSMRDIGFRNTEACSLVSRILIYHYREYEYALSYLDRGIEYSDDPEVTATLQYWKGIVLAKTGHYDSSVGFFKESMDYTGDVDSVLFQLGSIYTYNLKIYDVGLEYFDQINDAAAYAVELEFGRGFCHYHTGQYLDAITEFQKVVRTAPRNGPAYLMMGMAKIKLNQEDGACVDLHKALELGVRAAEKAIKSKCEAT